MPKKTTFEQVPLDVVKKIVERVKLEETTGSDGGIKKEKLKRFEQLPLTRNGSNGNGRKS
jgi:hypothetical protein